MDRAVIEEAVRRGAPSTTHTIYDISGGVVIEWSDRLDDGRCLDRRVAFRPISSAGARWKAYGRVRYDTDGWRTYDETTHNIDTESMLYDVRAVIARVDGWEIGDLHQLEQL